MRVLGPCPSFKCHGVDTISGPASGEPLKCRLCKVIWPDHSQGTLGIALRNKTVVPVSTFYSRRDPKSRSLLTTGLWLPLYLQPHSNFKHIVELVSRTIQKTFGLAVITDERNHHRPAALNGKWWGMLVDLRWMDVELPTVMDMSNEGRGHRSSREIMRYIRKLLHLLCIEDLPVFRRGYILKHRRSLPSQQVAALIQAVQQKMSTTPFRFRDGVWRPMTQPMGSAFPA